ncbi:hypothetical protein GCM10007216_18050 [Thalassobacillus devorans]|uniref:Uncharacterized protein n=1 Tax=Thalassobacillus devorans TaxID=279813 RepID=A0ABQ1NZF8_9BACI|nr:hypothetical protein [Thalassobacillus devorans]GGC87693.1 hypothetical protein GCM10007216_18050 [Thalassobacillus devorans]
MMVMIVLTISVYCGIAVYILRKIDSSPDHKIKGRNKVTSSMKQRKKQYEHFLSAR